MAILDVSKAISRERCKTGSKLLVVTNSNSYCMRLPLVPKLMTLNDLERRNGPYFALFHQIRVQYRRKTVTSVSKSTFDSL